MIIKDDNELLSKVKIIIHSDTTQWLNEYRNENRLLLIVILRKTLLVTMINHK